MGARNGVNADRASDPVSSLSGRVIQVLTRPDAGRVAGFVVGRAVWLVVEAAEAGDCVATVVVPVLSNRKKSGESGDVRDILQILVLLRESRMPTVALREVHL